MDTSYRVAAVVPTCRGFKIPEQTIKVDWYIVHDKERHALEVPDGVSVTSIVAPDPVMYGRGASSMRGAGFLKALKDGADYVLTVDDDCFIPPNWAEAHVAELLPGRQLWSNTIDGIPVRGYPMGLADVGTGISHGVWDGIQDLDGKTQKLYGEFYQRHQGKPHLIQAPFPMSSMNVGFRREVIPAMYFFPMGEDLPFDRFEDIWGGLVAQRVLMGHGYRFINNVSPVYHMRASDPDVNERKEAPGVACHEGFWRHIWDFEDYSKTIPGSVIRIAEDLKNYRSGSDDWDAYFSQVSRNLRNWAIMTVGALEF